MIIRGFDTGANDSMNWAIKLAEEHGNEKIDTIHLGYTLLYNEEILMMFEEITGLNGSKFREETLVDIMLDEGHFSGIAE